MKVFFQILCLVFMLLVFSMSLTAQTPTPQNNFEIIEPPDLNNYKDWQKVYFVEFSMYVPQCFQIETIANFEGGIRAYKNDEYNLRIYISSYAPRPSRVEERYENYKDKKIFIDNDFAWTWSYKREHEGYSYTNGIFIWFKKREGVYASVYLNSKDEQKGKELAKKMFHSIKFEEKLEEKPKTEESQKEIKNEKTAKKPCKKI